MSTTIKNTTTGEVMTVPYPLAEAYLPWVIVTDTRAEVALKRALKSAQAICGNTKEITNDAPTKEITNADAT